MVNSGFKYGLIGHNGSGKSILLKYISNPEFTKNYKFDIFCVNQEIPKSNKSIFEIVSSANSIKTKLLSDIEKLLETDNYDNNIYINLLDQLNQYAKDDHLIKKILFGLGFSNHQFDLPLSRFSGGWQTKVSLATGLYQMGYNQNPGLLLLDEPTNHLDIESVIWLRDYLIKWKKSLIIISHDTSFLNNICNKIIHLENQKLNYYNGNFDLFLKIYNQELAHKEKQWKKIQTKIKKLSKPEKLEILNQNSQFKPGKPYKINIIFPELFKQELRNPLLNGTNIKFGYSENNLFENINFHLNYQDKIAIVGKNGIGKSTFLKIISDKIKSDNYIFYQNNLRIGYYHQDLNNKLPLDSNPVDFINKTNPKLSSQEIRKLLGTIGLDGQFHFSKIGNLSGGQKSRVAFCGIICIRPHIYILDEPTNHLDLETITSLILAINNFNGATVFITHNIDLIEKTKSIVYKLENKKLIQIDFDQYCQQVINQINN